MKHCIACGRILPETSLFELTSAPASACLLYTSFGDIPKAVANLLQVALLKAMGHKAYVTEVRINRQEIRLTMYQNAKLDKMCIRDRYRIRTIKI